MSRYRPIDPRMWGDEKFKSLSKPKPNGQTLWQFLLTGPHTNGCPGLFHRGEMALSEELGWSLKDFRRCFREIEEKEMAVADWKARVVLVSNALKYDPPQSPNVVKKWAKDFDEIPECELKVRYYEIVKGFLEGYPKAFLDAFNKFFKKPSSKSFQKTSPNPEPKPEPKPIKRPEPEPEGFSEDSVFQIFSHWKEVMGHPEAQLSPERKSKIEKRLKEGATIEQCKQAIENCRASPYHRGENEHGTVYDDIGLIFRNRSKFEWFLNLKSTSPRNKYLVGLQDWADEISERENEAGRRKEIPGAHGEAGVGLQAGSSEAPGEALHGTSPGVPSRKG